MRQAWDSSSRCGGRTQPSEWLDPGHRCGLQQIFLRRRKARGDADMGAARRGNHEQPKQCDRTSGTQRKLPPTKRRERPASRQAESASLGFPASLLMHADAREMNDLDEWMNAGCALIATTQPDPKPMAALLRSNKPFPDGLRDLLAELLDPGEPPLYNVRLTPKSIQTALKETELFKMINVVAEYENLRNAGKSAIDARADAMGKYGPHGWSDESVFNGKRRRVRKLMKRVRSEDITGKKLGK